VKYNIEVQHTSLFYFIGSSSEVLDTRFASWASAWTFLYKFLLTRSEENKQIVRADARLPLFLMTALSTVEKSRIVFCKGVLPLVGCMFVFAWLQRTN
jgi:hypothetical protein